MASSSPSAELQRSADAAAARARWARRWRCSTGPPRSSRAASTCTSSGRRSTARRATLPQRSTRSARRSPSRRSTSWR
ncbi:hypothetical protein ACFSTI_07835 [Rhizorhabdus histidinilytica]